MKKLNSFLVVVCLLTACSSKDNPVTPSTTLTSTPEAAAAENNSSGGVYKGVFVGSSGSVKITLQNGKIEATLTLDGVTKTLTTTSLSGWATGQAIVNAVFASGDWSVTFSVGEDGSDPNATITIPGHTITVVILKETSSKLIKVFEGTYAGSETGTWNVSIKGSELMGISRPGSGGSRLFHGTLNNNNVTILDSNNDQVATGTLNGDVISGTWGTSNDFKGTWTGKRTL